MRRPLVLGALILGAALVACEPPAARDDLALARQAALERNWPLAERLLERYLHDGRDADKRFEAWQLLLTALNAGRSESRLSLDYLEIMLEEFSEDDARAAVILEMIGSTSERLRRWPRAEEAWSAYVGVAGLEPENLARGLRRLAATQFVQRKFQASEDSLEQCLAQGGQDEARAPCLLDLAHLLMAQERWQELTGLCRQILDSGAGPEEKGMAGYMLADGLEQLGKFSEALQQFEASEDIYPNPEVIQIRIAHLRAKMKGHSGK